MLSSKKVERKCPWIKILFHTLHGHFVNRQAQLMGHEPDDAKDDKASKEAGEAVANGHHKGISGWKMKKGIIKIDS